MSMVPIGITHFGRRLESGGLCTSCPAASNNTPSTVYLPSRTSVVFHGPTQP